MDKILDDDICQLATVSETEPLLIQEIGLVSDGSCLQNVMLAEQLQSQLNIPCHIFTAHEMGYSPFLLMDCNVLSAEDVKQLLINSFTKSERTVVALLNVEPDSEHESLISWTGINGIFYHNTDRHHLILGIEHLLKGDFWLSRRLVYSFLKNNRKAPVNNHPNVSLTRREEQVLRFIVQGTTNAQMAEKLFVSEHTIKSHLYNIFRKIDVKNRLEASNWARENL
jgi:DNA-binding NarL/FixJ family response regulator